MTLLPRISDTVEGLNDWYKANKSIIDQDVGAALEPVSRNFDAIALSVTALAAGSTRITSYNVCYTKLLRYRTRLWFGLAMKQFG